MRRDIRAGDSVVFRAVIRWRDGEVVREKRTGTGVVLYDVDHATPGARAMVCVGERNEWVELEDITLHTPSCPHNR